MRPFTQRSSCSSRPGWAQAILAAILLAGPAGAQVALGTAAGLSYAEGEVTLGGEKVKLAATRWTEVRDGELLRTGAGARAELMLNACVAMHVDGNSAVRIVSNRLQDTRVEIVEGAAIVRADGILRDTSATVTAGGKAIAVSNRGLFRFDAASPAAKKLKGVEGPFERWSDERAFVLLKESGYDPAAERVWEEKERMYRRGMADGRLMPGKNPPVPPPNRLRLCAGSSAR